jgi:hypothetical protein
MKAAYRTLFAAALLVASHALAVAQDTVSVGVQEPLAAGEALPQRVADLLVAYYNRPSTIRFGGRTYVPAGRSIGGDVAVLGGPVEIAGIVDGDLVVYNGDITLLEGSRVSGNLTVVGGVLIGADRGDVGGIITTYTAVFRYRRTNGGIEYAGSGRETYRPEGRTLALPQWELGESEIFVDARPYNRIEALPIVIGPRIMTGGSNPLRLEAFVIYRTVAGFSPEEGDVGWEVRLRQYLFGHRDVWLEAGWQSVIDPIENWKLSDLENSLTLFLFRRDYRDYYERQGWYGLLGWQTGNVFGSFEFRGEDHRTVNTRNVWTILFNKSDPLRPNAAVDQGELQSIVATFGIDTRNNKNRPWSGWYNRISVEQAVGGNLAGEDPDFTHLLLDLRRFFRVSLGSVLGFRFAGGGRLGDNPTPAQRQHMIGGAGSLPGYDMMQFDCGAREDPTFGTVPGYGCQRFALFQAEYRTSLNFNWRLNDEQVHNYRDVFSMDFDPAIVLFYDAGAAWSTDENYWDHLTDSDNWVADLGGGLELGGFGAYVAYPLTGSGGFNFLLRLTARF